MLGANEIVITCRSIDPGNRRSFPSVIKMSAKGTTIYHQGDPARYWYEVISGIVRTCRFLGDGHRQLTGFFYTDDVFGVDATSYREAAEAVTDVVLRRHAPALLDGCNEIASTRDKVLSKALESARQSIFLFGHRTAANRLAAFLLGIVDRPDASGPLLPMTRSDIADHLNLTLHTVSRTISEFARNGLIALDGPQHVRVLDHVGLRAAAGDMDDERGDGVKPELENRLCRP